MSTETIEIKFKSVGLKETISELKQAIKLMKQLHKEQKKVKIK